MWPSRKTSPIQMTTGNNYPSVFCLSGLQKCTHLSVTARCSFLPTEIWNNFGAFLESVHHLWIHLDQLFLLNDISHSITDYKWVYGWSTTHLQCFLSSFGSFLMRCCSETHFRGGEVASSIHTDQRACNSGVYLINTGATLIKVMCCNNE